MPSDAFVKLMFTYYDDVVLSSLDDAAEVMFTRGLGYCGRAGTGGFIPESKLLDLTRKTSMTAARRVADSLCVQVSGFNGPWEKVSGGYFVRNYGHFQDGLEAIQQRRKNDRERKARQREMSRDSSRDESREVTVTKKKKRKKEEEETPNGVSAFDDFWDAYPRREGKGQARRAWATATKKAEPEGIITAAAEFAEWCRREQTEQRYIALPSTWLNGERWTDERASRSGTEPKRVTADQLEQPPDGLSPEEYSRWLAERRAG